MPVGISQLNMHHYGEKVEAESLFEKGRKKG